jgi:hypothetical protein
VKSQWCTPGLSGATHSHAWEAGEVAAATRRSVCRSKRVSLATTSACQSKGNSGLSSNQPRWRGISNQDSMCDTVPMSYHETLWLAISASAPVIALASIVSIGDSYKLDEMSQRSGQVGREIGVWPVFINAANMALQIGALLGALLSLYNGRDSGHGLIFVVLTQPLGIALLSIATLMNGAERLKAKKLRSNTENPKREDKE